MRHTKTTETILFSILFLFFLQSLSDFIEAIYAFGLLVTAFTIEVASIILLFTPLLLLVFRKAPSRSFLLGLSIVAIAARLLEPLLSPGGKLVACGISVGAFMMLFPLLLQRRAQYSRLAGHKWISHCSLPVHLFANCELRSGFVRVRDLPGHRLAAGNPGRDPALARGPVSGKRFILRPGRFGLADDRTLHRPGFHHPDDLLRVRQSHRSLRAGPGFPIRQSSLRLLSCLPFLASCSVQNVSRPGLLDG